jgi:hypothetical protein
MNTNHTSLYDGDDASGYTKPLFDIVGKGHEEKARHIADCVNACAGIVNPEIKIPQLKDALIEAVEQLQKTEQQNAELVVELKKAISLRVTLYRHSDMEGDTDKLTDDEIVQRDVFARQWTQAIAKAGEAK